MAGSKRDGDEGHKSIPTTRVGRLARVARMAGGVAGGMLAEGTRQLRAGKRPRARDMLLTPGNARRVAEQLSTMRGAAMKVGQLLSMDAGDLLPAEMTAIIARLRADAKPMPMSEVVDMMQSSFGQGWEHRFTRFSFTPMAAASIGQVHAATTRSGRQLALKIQYPGIRQSINSDVDNVATLLRISRLVPEELALEPLLQEAKRQLHEEADYLREAGHLQRFAMLLEDAPEFVVPGVDEDLTRENILAMDLLAGEPIESLTYATQTTRDRVVGLLLGLSAITVPWDTLFLSVVLYILVPVIIAQLLRKRLLAKGGEEAFQRALQRLGPASLVALLATLVLLFGFQGEQILRQPLVIVLLAVPILIQVYFNSGLAYLLNRRFGVAHCVPNRS